jgi:hypothetical protein
MEGAGLARPAVAEQRPARLAPRHILEDRQMSTEDKPEKPHEDGPQTTPEWHRARAKDLRKNGFTKMAEEREQIAQMIERQQKQHTK